MQTTDEQGTTAGQELATREVPAANGLDGHALELLVATSRRFRSEISLISNGRRANAKSLFSVASLRKEVQSSVTIEAKGNDAGQAIIAIDESITAFLGE